MRPFPGIATILLLAAPSACGDDGTGPSSREVATIALSIAAAEVTLGDTVNVYAVAQDSTGREIPHAAVALAVADTSIAALAGARRLVGKRVGMTTLLAVSDTVITRLEIRVVARGEDAFSANSLSEYSIFGSSPDPHLAWSVSGGQLRALGTFYQAVAIRKDVTYADGWVETELDYADDGGLVLRFADNGNYLLAAIRDDASRTLLQTRNLEIYERRNGTFFSIATFGGVDVAWPRGTSRRVRFEARGSLVRILVDGQVADSTHATSRLGRGGVGLRHKGDAADWEVRYETFRWRGEPAAEDVTAAGIR